MEGQLWGKLGESVSVVVKETARRRAEDEEQPRVIYVD